jgi:hypothetical protein
MKHETYVIPRKSKHGITVAILTASFTVKAYDEGLSNPSNLLRVMKQVFTEWVKTTDEGRKAWEDSGGDFNIGDVANHFYSGSRNRLFLYDALVEHGIEISDIDVHSMDGDRDAWEFDTVLVNKEKLEATAV